MATENKRLQTRLMLKYDSYANWTTNNPLLLKGEVAIAYIDVAENTQSVSGQSVPQLLMKVGNGLEGDAGKYNALPFVSGLAADVHSWAKAANKPSYAINEISGAKEYQVVKGASEYEWKLQAHKAGSSDAWADVSTIDLAKLSERMAAIEEDVADHETRLSAAEGTIGDKTKGLVKDVADLKALMGEEGEGSVADKIADAIDALDITKTQTAGADGLALEVVQENGLIKSISGSIAAKTYDAYGSASAVEGKLNEYKTSNDTAVQKAQADATAAGNAVAQEKLDRENAINALDFAGVEGVQTGTEIKFVNKVSQENGVVSAELGTLVFNSAVSADNKAATMADVTTAVADLTGAMHFEGFSTTDPETGVTIEGKADYVAAAGDVIIYNTIEYVYDGSKWQKLGEEGALGAAIEALSGNSTGAKSKTVTAHVQANGVVTLTYEDIAIAESQVGGLTDKLAAMQKEIDDEEARAAAAEKVNADAIDVIEGNDAGKSMRTVAGEVATASVNALNSEKTLGADETVLVAKQTNGAVSVTTQKIQIAESQVTGLTAALALKATEADLTLAENRIKANEDDIATLKGDASVTGSVAQKIKTAIDALDKADAEVEGQFVSAVSEENGVISVTRKAVNIKDLEQTADTYVVFDCGSSSVNV